MFRFNENKKWFWVMGAIVVCLALAGTARAGWPEMEKLLDDVSVSPPWRWAGDYAGYSVSISGDYAIVGAHGDRYIWPGAGAAYIFNRDGAN